MSLDADILHLATLPIDDAVIRQVRRQRRVDYSNHWLILFGPSERCSTRIHEYSNRSISTNAPASVYGSFCARIRAISNCFCTHAHL